MSKTITKIELDGTKIVSKPFLLDETLSSIRDKIKERTNNINYAFLDSDGNNIEYEDEKDFKLSDIIVDKTIKLSSLEKGNGQSIKILLNNNEICSKNISQTAYLSELRACLINDIKESFKFLDNDGCDIDLNDEKDFTIKDIIDKQYVKIKCDKNIQKTPEPNIQTKQNNNQNSNSETNSAPTPIRENKIKIDLSKYEEIKSNDLYVEDIKLYRYSKVPAEIKHDRVF